MVTTLDNKELNLVREILETKFNHLDDRLDSVEKKVDDLQYFKIKIVSIGSVATFFGSIIAFLVGTAIDLLKAFK